MNYNVLLDLSINFLFYLLFIVQPKSLRSLKNSNNDKFQNILVSSFGQFYWCFSHFPLLKMWVVN